MEWTLVSYTEIERPLPPYVPVHIVGIVENEKGERALAKVDPHSKLYIGMKGKLLYPENEGLNVFRPIKIIKKRIRSPGLGLKRLISS